MKDLFEWEMGLQSKVQEVNQRLLENIYSDQEALYRMAKYTIEAGGKRFRPLLTILAFEISSDEPYQKILDLAAGYELIHTASLIHDDIIDESPTRRGRPTLNAVEGINNAIVVGDYLFAKAYELGSRYGPTVSKIMADASSRLAEGQILESLNLGNLYLSEDTYLQIIKNKTADFFAACAFGATTAAGADANIATSLTDFAFNLGMAFQVTDDILDIVGDEIKMGKPAFVDLQHSAITLPMIHALRNSTKEQSEEIENIITGKYSDEDARGQMKSIYVNTGALDYSFAKARSYTENAIKSLNKTGGSPDLDLLMELAMIVIERIEQLG